MVGNMDVSWVVLTRGDRPEQLRASVDSIRSAGGRDIVVVANGVEPDDLGSLPGARVVAAGENLGVPAGRNLGLEATTGELVGFLDDDARLLGGDVVGRVAELFTDDVRLGAVSFRLVDEAGESATRHVPRPGGRHASEEGRVVNFLGGACVVRRSAFETAGGYWGDLFYAHEEVELAWRLYDAGFHVGYVPGVEVFHPRTEISRHESGWFRTGRNRVLIGRRTLPWPIAAVHVTLWLGLGLWRAPGGTCRRAYLRGWAEGWRVEVDRAPIRWSTVVQLTRSGRPPVI